MSKVRMLRAMVKQQLTAAAEEIFGLFETTIAEYEAELCRSREENERQRERMDAVFNPQLRLHRADLQQVSVVKDSVPPEQQERSSSLDQEEPEPPPHIKEDQEQLCSSQEGEQLHGLEEADIKFLITPVPVKSEEDDGEEAQSSQLHQRQSEHMETEAGGEDCGGAEPDRNSHPHPHPEPDTEKMAKRNTPAKRRAQKRLNSFKQRSAEWAKGMRRNRNMEKMKALGLRPLLFYGVYDEKRSRYDTKVICPYSMSNETEVMLKKMNMLYSVLLQAWTPEDEGRRRKEKRKGKKGNRRPVSGVEGAAAAAPLSGEEGAVAPDSGAEEAVAPGGGDREPPVSVIQQFKKLFKAKKTAGGEAAVVDRGEESSCPVVQQLKIQVKKKRQTSRECGLHPYADAFEAWKLGQTKQKQGVDYVYVFWKSCEGCGETWRPSWEPAMNIEFGT
ncbi:uncharacterized protein LOC114568719 isoform X2 [Perca flavescens]|uniref:uncharacterized protein LOC114568719 isoform X2 n=1 Tax=Perca flavescens TaxID=8167 RepID=UPI00106EC8B6|nr:uncharacterized protein LOC114568719 isoform X2 [Perca flavescens]